MIWTKLIHCFDKIDLFRTKDDIWDRIFENEQWLDVAIYRYHVHPALIGLNIDSRGKALRLCLVAPDSYGELRWHIDAFFSSLRKKYRYNPASHEVTLPGTILNVHNVTHNFASIPSTPGQYFQGSSESLETYYIFYERRDDGLLKTNVKEVSEPFASNDSQALLIGVYGNPFYYHLAIKYEDKSFEISLRTPDPDRKQMGDDL